MFYKSFAKRLAIGAVVWYNMYNTHAAQASKAGRTSKRGSMLKAVIFDFDGTLADTVPALCEGINLTMQRFGYPTHTEADILRFINNGARELVRRAMPQALQADEQQVSRTLSVYNDYYGQVYLHTQGCYEGVRETVAQLHAEGLRIGVLSNKQDAYVKGLCRAVLAPHSYDAAQGVLEGHPTKPHPYLTTRVAQALGVETSECAVVGDSDVDIRTAENAGMGHIGVTWGYRTEEFLRAAGATRLAHNAAELAAIIKQEREKREC